MPNLSVCFLTNTYPEVDSSYRAIFVRKMVLRLQRDGYRICVVTPKIFRGSRYFEEQGGVQVYRFPFFARNRLLIEYKRIPYLRMILYYISGAAVTLYALLRNRCHFIHVHWAIPTGLIGVPLGALLRKPLVVTVHGSDFRMAAEGSSFLRKIFLFVCHHARFVHCVSEVMRRGLEEMGVEKEKITTFPMGIDEAFFEAGKGRKRKSKDQPWTVLSNRNLHPLYNVSSLIRAIPRVLEEEPKTRFLIAGEGPEKEFLERESIRLNLGRSVQFLGRIPNEKMPDLLAETDIYVSTSLSDGTSVSLLEAMAAGAFSIVTEIPSNIEWVMDRKNGFLVPTEGEEPLARRILDAIRNHSLAEGSRLENADVVRRKALWSVVLERTKEIYHRGLECQGSERHRDCL
jgi:L-malate glycosyltransferase